MRHESTKRPELLICHGHGRNGRLGWKCSGGRTSSAQAEELPVLRRKNFQCSGGRTSSAQAEELPVLRRKNF